MLVIRHETELEYTSEICETVMEVRVTPSSDQHQIVRGHRVDVAPASSLLEYQDWLGNRTYQFSILPYHQRVVFHAHCAVEVAPQHGDFAAWPALELRPESAPPLFDFLWPSTLIVDEPGLDALAIRLGLQSDAPALVAVERVTRHLTDEIMYEKGVTTSGTTVTHVLDKRAGVCQDLAHVAIGLLRRRGIAARYVSGYFLPETGDPELETHAWLEVYWPPLGWVGVDPTHQTVRGPGHVVVAVGRDYADVPPNRGVFRGDARESIIARVFIERASGVPDGLLAPRTDQLDVELGGEASRLHSEGLRYEQAQQQQQ